MRKLKLFGNKTHKPIGKKALAVLLALVMAFGMLPMLIAADVDSVFETAVIKGVDISGVELEAAVSSGTDDQSLAGLTAATVKIPAFAAADTTGTDPFETDIEDTDATGTIYQHVAASDVATLTAGDSSSITGSSYDGTAALADGDWIVVKTTTSAPLFTVYAFEIDLVYGLLKEATGDFAGKVDALNAGRLNLADNTWTGISPVAVSIEEDNAGDDEATLEFTLTQDSTTDGTAAFSTLNVWKLAAADAAGGIETGKALKTAATSGTTKVATGDVILIQVDNGTTYFQYALVVTVTAKAPSGGDTDKPTFTITPDHNDTGVALFGNIVITFNEAMDTDVFGEVILKGPYLGDGWSLDYDNTSDWTGGTTLTVKYWRLGFGETYTITVTGFKDVAGNEMNDRTVSFTATAGFTISGTVTDDDTNDPIEDAWITYTIGDAPNTWTIGSYTNAVGEYAIKAPAGTYALTATARGYARDDTTHGSVAVAANVPGIDFALTALTVVVINSAEDLSSLSLTPPCVIEIQGPNGHLTLDDNLTVIDDMVITIGNGGTLTVGAGYTLTVNDGGIIENKGTIIIEDTGVLGNSGLVENYGTVSNEGTITSDGTIDNYGTLNNTGTVTNDGYFWNEGTINTSGTFTNNGGLDSYYGRVNGNIGGSGWYERPRQTASPGPSGTGGGGGGRGGGGARAPFTSSKTDPEEKYVDVLYMGLLGRKYDAAGFAFWVEQLESGKMTYAQVARHFIFSEEVKAAGLTDVQFVTRLYNGLLGRNPDTGGLDFWVAHLGRGVSKEAIFNAFVASTEFTARLTALGLKV